MGRRAVSFALLLAAALLPPQMAAALPNPTSAAGNPTIVIGVIATLSGPGALAGQDELDGVITAVRQLGGRFANQEVKVVAVDDHGSPDTALQVTQRLLEHEKVDFVMTAVSQASMAAIIKTLLDSRVFILNLDATPLDLAGSGCNPSLFDLSTPPDALHEALGAVLSAEKMRRLVVVAPDIPQTDLALAALRRTWTGEVMTVLRPRHGAATFAAELDTVRRLSPDAVYSLLTGGMGLSFVRDYAAAGLKTEIPLIGNSNGFERPLLAAMDDAALDILTVSSWSPDLDVPVNRRLIADFEAEYARPVTSWVAQGYDAALLIDSAMRATNGRTGDRDAVRNALRRADFSSVRGAFRFDPNQMPSLTIYQRRVTRDTKGRLTQELHGIALRDWHNHHINECPMRWSEESVAPRASKQAPATPAPTAPVVPPPPPPVLLDPPPLDADMSD
ncbi:ABC transporter substrate-binding protein [Magnetospirillum molischianum]|uniref:ABC-type branched-chain amino acid transport systems, periplasmic component n=1 Tax=Magnetospirillum molischianum DSM 120 TaxID=1150626 RepID=H8FXK8_MAGML|nr:ABC transporter substrate-binding protein [Magnetospirillum molischianum]CCG43096.1 ABC-type branched-chain amino acid transport systems, periplasmic component [Magnetospirillum molischianum DSM 120]